MDDQPFRHKSMHPEIAQLFAGTRDRPSPDHRVSLELCVEPDAPAEAERLQVVRTDARRHLVLVLDSHRRRADALAAINGDDRANTHCVGEPPSPIP